ncbi:hypothetical protein HPP92_015127 [Vanilla planifolia]|uniref:Phospholipid scramblase n=1 Tax=Vanilla planifolia TaxID=51239 RepID=A0A835QHA3_VANPL|nr:hypothetical protein HPP92_015127 [Vanilla planifolia]
MMNYFKNLNLLPMYARFVYGFSGVSLLRDQGIHGCLKGANIIENIVNKGCYDEMCQCIGWFPAFSRSLGSGNLSLGFSSRAISGNTIMKNSVSHSNMLNKYSIKCYTSVYSAQQVHVVSRGWLAKRWAAEKRKKDAIRKRKRRYTQHAETKEPASDTLFQNPFSKPFFVRSIPVKHEWKANEASLQPPISQFEEGLLYPQTSEGIKLAPLLARANLLITRDIEWANIVFAFEQENRYAVMDPCYPQSPVGFIREKSNVLTRQLLRTRRPFIAYITDAMGNEIFRVRRPFWWITSTIYAEVDGKEVGVVHRRWHLWRRIYDLYLGNKQFAVVENPGLWNWTFTLKDEDDNVLAQIDRDWRGLGLELFTDAGQYVIRFGNVYSSPKLGLASAVQELDVARPLTLSERAVAVALAISLDNDFFSRTVGGWGLPIIVAGE